MVYLLQLLLRYFLNNIVDNSVPCRVANFYRAQTQVVDRGMFTTYGGCRRNKILGAGISSLTLQVV